MMEKIRLMPEKRNDVSASGMTSPNTIGFSNTGEQIGGPKISDTDLNCLDATASKKSLYFSPLHGGM